MKKKLLMFGMAAMMSFSAFAVTTHFSSEVALAAVDSEALAKIKVSGKTDDKGNNFVVVMYDESNTGNLNDILYKISEDSTDITPANEDVKTWSSLGKVTTEDTDSHKKFIPITIEAGKSKYIKFMNSAKDAKVVDATKFKFTKLSLEGKNFSVSADEHKYIKVDGGVTITELEYKNDDTQNTYTDLNATTATANIEKDITYTIRYKAVDLTSEDNEKKFESAEKTYVASQDVASNQDIKNLTYEVVVGGNDDGKIKVSGFSRIKDDFKSKLMVDYAGSATKVFANKAAYKDFVVFGSAVLTNTQTLKLANYGTNYVTTITAATGSVAPTVGGEAGIRLTYDSINAKADEDYLRVDKEADLATSKDWKKVELQNNKLRAAKGFYKFRKSAVLDMKDYNNATLALASDASTNLEVDEIIEVTTLPVSPATEDEKNVEPKKDETKKEEPKKDDTKTEAPKTEEPKTETPSEEAPVNKTVSSKKAAATVSAEDVALVTGKLTVKVKGATLALPKAVLSDGAVKVSLKAMAPKKDSKDAKALTKNLKKNKLVDKNVYSLSVKTGTKGVNGKFTVTLSTSLKKAPKNLYVMNIANGKLMKAKFSKGKVTFTAGKAGKFVVVSK